MAAHVQTQADIDSRASAEAGRAARALDGACEGDILQSLAESANERLLDKEVSQLIGDADVSAIDYGDRWLLCFDNRTTHTHRRYYLSKQETRTQAEAFQVARRMFALAESVEQSIQQSLTYSESDV